MLTNGIAVCYTAAMSKVPPTTIRLADDDRDLIDVLKRRYGIASTTQLIRVALRMMAERSTMPIDSHIRSQSDTMHDK